MFEDFFTTYNMVEPPKIYKDNPDLAIRDIEESNITKYPMVTTIDNPTMATDILDYPGVFSPFDILVEEPLRKPEITEVNNKATDVVNLARQFLNKPYVWGAADPDKGFDCSGLINYVYKLIGVDLPRTSHAMGRIGTEVQLSEVLPGDIIYTSSKGPSGGHVKMVSSVSNGLISVIEAKGKKWGIVESPLTNTSNIKSIRRVLDNMNRSLVRTSLIFSSPLDFVNTLNAAYKLALLNRGLDPNFSTILVALDAGETGWGKDIKGNFNYGNITAGRGEPWHNKTGKRKWRDFTSIDDYVNKKIDFLSRPRYKFFETFTPSSNIAVAMQTLANRGYDPGNPSYGLFVYAAYKTLLKYL